MHSTASCHDACDALEKLRATGGAGLFWGERDASAADEQLRRARDRSSVFGKHVGGIEDRRRSLIERIREHEFQAGIIEDDLFEAQEEEELRKLDWIIERELKELPARELVMPWTRRGEEDRRYRKSLAASLLFCMLLAIVFPMIDLPLLRCRRGREGAGPHRAHAGQGAAEAARAGAPGNQAAGGSEACRAAGREAEAEAA